jgi:3-oxoacyl-[acyl-carrier protein] reductase
MVSTTFINQTVFISGSSRGIGKAIAYAFGINGAHVILNGSKDQDSLNTTKQSFEKEGISCSAFLGDLGNYEIAKNIFKNLGKIDVLINNAGISHIGLFQDISPSIWHHIMQTNLYSAYNCCHLTIPQMIHRQQGIIINISSIWGKTGASCEVAYSTSKSALNGFTRALAKEVAPSNIRVNAIACGWIETEMNNCFTLEEKFSFVEEIPLGRFGAPQEVASTCLYLASPASTYMTGQVITLDGGLL